MGLSVNGLQSGGAPAGGATTDISARSFTATQVAGADAFAATVAGARWHIGPGTTDYFESNGTTTIGSPATIASTASIGFRLDTGKYIAFDAGNSVLLRASTTLLEVDAVGLVAAVTNSRDLGQAATVWRNLFLGGSLALSSSDSSGTPGAATINLPNGRSAIALGAASVVITNSLVTAASHVFISPRTRDATGTLPLVTTIGAGSFTVTTAANCTAALVFDWLVTA